MKKVELVPLDGTIDAWQQAIYAFLAEKERRSGSMRTVCLQPHAPAVLRYAVQDAGRGHEPGRVRVRSRPRSVRQGTRAGHHRLAAGLHQLVLQVPHPHEADHLQPL